MSTVRAAGVVTPDSKDWWTADHPFGYENRFAKLADGRTVFANVTNTLGPLQNWRQTLHSPIARWYFSKNGSRTIKTVRNLIKDIQMTPIPDMRTRQMDGRYVVQSPNAKNAGKGMAAMYKRPEFLKATAKQVKMLLGFVKKKYSVYINGQIREAIRGKYSAAQLQKMFIEKYNITTPTFTVDDYNELKRDKHVKPYEWDGDQRRLAFFKTFSVRFQPFEGYGNVYYTPDDEFPEPTVPAASYPWKWSAHLAVVRDIALGIIAMREDAASKKLEEMNDDEGDKYELPTTLLPQTDDEEKYLAHLKRMEEDDDYVRSFATHNHQDEDGDAGLPFRRMLRQMTNDSDSVGINVEDTASMSGSELFDPNEEFIDEQALDTMERVTLLLNQFHFSSGIPRFTMQKNESRHVFPSFAAYQRNVSRYLESVQRDQGEDFHKSMDELVESQQYHREDDEQLERRRLMEDPPTLVNAEQHDPSEYSFEGDDTIYAALLDFYAYPAIDKELLVVDDDEAPEAGTSSREAVPECKLLDPCRMQSGVTAYTPLLTNLSVFSLFADPNSPAALSSPTAVRMAGLRDMVETAFATEREALRHGLQAPSTVWYSLYDQESDEFADAIIGSANMKNAAEVLSPSATFERFFDRKKSLIDFLPSYYRRTVANSVYVMDNVKSVPKPMNFSEPELVEFLDFILAQFKSLDEAVTAYKRIRDRDPQRQIMVNMTQSHEFYYGSEYTLLGFGYVMPQTNDKNAVFRDMRLPVGSHLLVRLFTRFHESRVMLPEESRFIFACLALLLNDTPYYRCRPRKAPPAPIID